MRVLSVDIGGTNFRVGIVSENGTIEKLDRIPTDSVIRSGNVLEDLFRFLSGYPDVSGHAEQRTNSGRTGTEHPFYGSPSSLYFSGRQNASARSG